MSLDNLPVEWFETTLDQIAEWGSGGTPSRKNASYYGGDVPWIKTGDLGDKYVTQATEFITEEAVKNSSAKFFKKGSVIMAMYGATIGKTSILGIDATTNQACAVGTPIATSTDFLYYFLKNEKDSFIAKGKGGAQPNISQQIIKAHTIYVPSLAEQQEIVRQLDVMLAQVEQIKARLDAIPAILKKFRQSLLADAVSGKLTEEWRSSENPKCDLEAELKQIKVNRENKIFGNQKRSLDFSVDENLKPVVELPASWKLVGLGDLIEFLTDYHANGSYEKLRDHVTLLDEENYACMIRATNFEKNNFDDLLIYIDQTAYEFLTKTKLFGNEILISKIGNAGSVYLMPKLNRPCSLAMNLFMLRFDESLVNPRYINYFLTSIFGEKYISQYVRGVATKSIDKKSVRNVFVHYPCLNEQNQIVKIIDQLFAYANRIEETVKSAQKRVNLLTQSILAKAFSGELTAEWREQHQDLITGVNSTESLLAKIQKEREASKLVKKAKKVK